MVNLKLSELTEDLLASITVFTQIGLEQIWEPQQATLTPSEEQQIQHLKTSLRYDEMTIFNEATVWARAIYPLLFMAERRPVRAWAQVPLAATFPQFSLNGVADGVLGMSRSGHPATPYLIIIEAKKGLENTNPQAQLYGAMLATARLNWQHQPHEPQEAVGCYTIADTWVFVHAQVTDIDKDKPHFAFATSREYFERLEAETILGILKAIVAKWLNPASDAG